MYNDSLFRVFLKCYIVGHDGKVLVVRETGRGSWDLPGGGIDHGESLRAAIARELEEEISYKDDFTYEILRVDDPVKLRTRDVWQLKVIFKVTLSTDSFRPGKDADEVSFVDPKTLKDSTHLPEQAIYEYSKTA